MTELPVVEPKYVPPASSSLQTFTMGELAPFTKEGELANSIYGGAADFSLFYVGRDNVHELLKYILSRVTVSLYLNMFGYDDEELNDILMAKAHDPSIVTAYTLDKSQSGGVHEKAILASDAAKDPAAFSAHFAIGQSASHQITHTKGWVADGRVGGEGSTNWSSSGEGTFVVAGNAADQAGHGYKAQNNTQSVFTDRGNVARFQAELIAEHLVVVAQGGALKPN